jgi:hypothetical protein
MCSWATDSPVPVSHIRSISNGLPWFLLPFGVQLFIIVGNLLSSILLTCCKQFLLYSCTLFKTGVVFICIAISVQVHRPNAAFLVYFIPALNIRVNGKVIYTTAVAC